MIKREMILAQNPWLTDVSVVAETTSTQIDAKNDLVDKKLFIADMQTQTRGRFGRQYFASNGDGIYMSLVLKISEDVKDYTILTAAAVLTAIENLTTKKPLVKWVNDIYLDNKNYFFQLLRSFRIYIHHIFVPYNSLCQEYVLFLYYEEFLERVLMPFQQLFCSQSVLPAYFSE